MDLRLTDEQEQLVEAFSGLFAKQSSPEQVRAAEPVGFDADLWSRLTELGVVAMAVGEDAGGWGASLLDLTLVAEQLGRAVAPAPIVEAQVAARLLARLGGGPAADALATAVAGERIVTLALHPTRGDQARLVPAAAVADDVIVRHGDRLLLVPGAGRDAHVENLGSMPVADVAVPADAVELASGADAAAALDRAL
ncbi:MAG: acyl-CoA dehydrogenase family protein, partial [Actinomycetota bacterium]|nr:acyl-CoA dehydrogenase family protein [Actinomycetota bacterium]